MKNNLIRNQGLPSERVRDYATWGTDIPLDILIAEDNPENQKLIARILNKMAYQQIKGCKTNS